jgi:hypothetical protein
LVLRDEYLCVAAPYVTVRQEVLCYLDIG